MATNKTKLKSLLENPPLNEEDSASKSREDFLLEEIKKSREEILSFETDIKTDYQKIKDESAKFEVRLVEILALFVGLFTFISINVQVFNSQPLSLLSATGFVFITLGGISFFITLLAFLVLDRDLIRARTNSNVLFFILFVTVLITLGGGFYLVVRGDSNSLDKFNKTYYSRADAESDTNKLNQQIIDFKQCILKKGLYPCLQ